MIEVRFNSIRGTEAYPFSGQCEDAAESVKILLIRAFFRDIFKVNPDRVVACYEVLAVEFDDRIPIFTDDVVVVFAAPHPLAIQPDNFTSRLHDDVLSINGESIFATSFLSPKDQTCGLSFRDSTRNEMKFSPLEIAFDVDTFEGTREKDKLRGTEGSFKVPQCASHIRMRDTH